MNDKMSKITNKSTWAILLSIVAILMCLLAFGLWIFEVIPHSVVMPETFIGVCVALMGVIVTVAVGWQIYNAIEIKSIIREYAQKQAEVERLQMQLKTEISRITIDAEYDVHHSLHLHAITLALHCEMKKKYAEPEFDLSRFKFENLLGKVQDSRREDTGWDDDDEREE